MICLFLDTSSDNLIVSLLKDDKVIFEKIVTSLRDHSTYLVPIVKEAFESNNIELKDLNKIFVGIGPGSFTGTRIAITFAKTIAYSLNVDLIPISSIEEYIYSVDGYDYYVPVLEEKRDMLYFSVFDKSKKRLIEDTYASKEEFLEYLKRYEGKLGIISNSNFEGYDNHSKEINVSKMIGYIKDNEPVNPHTLKPNYIKRIEVESKL